ncbi:hypothetical protein PoB_005756600, partial [Plakobranchus ocellatus]
QGFRRPSYPFSAGWAEGSNKHFSRHELRTSDTVTSALPNGIVCLLCIAIPEQDDLRFSGPLFGRSAVAGLESATERSLQTSKVDLLPN